MSVGTILRLCSLATALASGTEGNGGGKARADSATSKKEVDKIRSFVIGLKTEGRKDTTGHRWHQASHRSNQTKPRMNQAKPRTNATGLSFSDNRC